MIGLNLLKSRSQIIDVDVLNTILGYRIDSSLKLFYSIYELGQKGFHNAYRSFEDIDIPITFIVYTHEIDLEIRLSHFYSLDNIMQRWEDDIIYSEIYKHHNLLPIAYTEISLDHIFVNPKDGGGIFYFRNNKKIQLTTNIFEFCLGLRETEILDEDFKNKKVYKNWGEDFWQIREENQSV